MTTLELINVSSGYENKKIISDLSLKLPAGQLIALAGPNGSGKTTLLKTLSRLLKPLAGQVLWNGQNIYQLPYQTTAKIFGFLSQIEPVEDNFTVQEMIALGRYPWLSNIFSFSDQDRKQIEEVLENFGLKRISHRPVSQLSGGEFQTARIARLIAQTPQALFLDEPTMHLDIKAQFFVLNLLKNLLKKSLQENKPLLIVATFHDLNQVLFFADEVILLSGGKIVASGPTHQTVTPANIRGVYGLEVQLSKVSGSDYLVCLPSEKN